MQDDGTQPTPVLGEQKPSLFRMSKLTGIRMSNVLRNKVIFRETLLVGTLEKFANAPTPTGGLCIDVQKGSNRSFVVHISSQFGVNDANGGSLLLSYVDADLFTMEETKTEFMVNQDNTRRERKYLIGMERKFYVIKTLFNGKTEHDKAFSFKRCSNLVCEGASIILMRLMAITKFFGQIEMKTFQINGLLSKNTYKSLGIEGYSVNGTKVDAMKIVRIIEEESGRKHTCVTILTTSGQICFHEWENVDYVVYVNPFARFENKKPVGPQRLLLEKTWKDDVYFFSRYLDKEMSSHKYCSSYMKDHPELQSIVADYFLAILQIKPENVIDFSINHFLHYSPYYLPFSTYFSSSSSDSQ